MTTAKGTGGCVPGDLTLCLGDGRFAVEVEFVDPTNGNTVTDAHAVDAGGTSGFFWFFNEQNIELAVKVLDGRGLNGQYWVFYGALSNVEYTVTVTDTNNGNQAIYTNEAGTLCGQADTEALPGS